MMSNQCERLAGTVNGCLELIVFLFVVACLWFNGCI